MPLKTEHGNCGQKHQHGYLGVDDTGHEGLIGGIVEISTSASTRNIYRKETY
jgi:hypothetical protein